MISKYGYLSNDYSSIYLVENKRDIRHPSKETNIKNEDHGNKEESQNQIPSPR